MAPVRAPHCNPVERTNRTIKTVISQFFGKNHHRWDEQLDSLKFAYNSAKHEGTGFSPAYLNYGRELSGPHPTEWGRRQKSDTAERILKRLNETRDMVQIHMARAFQRQEEHYNLRRRAWRPRLGEWVWKKSYPLSNKDKAFNSKLAPKYIGPLQVRRIVSPVIVDLQDRQRKWYKHIHIQDLKADNNSSTNHNTDRDDTEEE